MSRVAGVARADFLERMRRFSFVAMLALALFAAFWFVPRDNGGMQVMSIQADVFVQGGNPSWIPVASAWGLGFFLPLVGFFYLRGALADDEITRRADLVTASSIGRLRYLLGKLVAGTLLLYAITLVVMLGSLVMLLWQFPNQPLAVGDYVLPFMYAFFSLPLVAALSLLLDSIRPLRGAWGSVAFIVAFIGLYTLIAMTENTVPFLVRVVDVTGSSVIVRHIQQAVLEQSGAPLTMLMFLGNPGERFNPTLQLSFAGFRLDAQDWTGMMGQLGAALGLTALAAPLYNLSQRLGTVRLRKRKTVRKNKKHQETPTLPQTVPAAYAPVPVASSPGVLGGLVAELRLMLAGQQRIWWLVALGGWVASIFLPVAQVQSMLLPLLALWFLNVFSALGSREHQRGILDLVSVQPGGRRNQILRAWLAGLALSLGIALPLLVRLLAGGQFAAAFACFAGIVFLPGFAMLAGELTGTRRCFELLFVAMVYMLLNGLPGLMYYGAPDAPSVGLAALYLGLGLGMGMAAVVKRLAVR